LDVRIKLPASQWKKITVGIIALTPPCALQSANQTKSRAQEAFTRMDVRSRMYVFHKNGITMVTYAQFIALVSVVKMKYCVKDTQIQWDAKLLTFVFQKVLRPKETISEENAPAIAPRFALHMKCCALAKLIVTAA
jgi:hypothetical protein